MEEEQKKLCSSSKEDIAAKLFRDMFIPQKKQVEIAEMEEIMKRFPLKESKWKIWKNENKMDFKCNNPCQMQSIDDFKTFVLNDEDNKIKN